MNRDILHGAPGGEPELSAGRKVVAVVGIDRYRSWPRLHNAVNDARGARALFLDLGFEEVVPPLLDDMATGAAIRRLVTDDLSKLGGQDSLVLFFAGHGHTQISTFENSQPIKSGYIVPVDGDRPGGLVASWLRIDSWLSDVARLPVRHILAILDACYSGVALGSLLRWRGAGGATGGSLDSLHRRRSRRVITSALDDQRALDNGPIEGHSLFTGCLMEGLTSGLAKRGRTIATSSEIGLYVQERVTTYPGSTQTPDFGTLELDDRGELVIQLAGTPLARTRCLAPGSGDPAADPTRRLEQRPSEPSEASRGMRTARRALLFVALAASIYVGVNYATVHDATVKPVPGSEFPAVPDAGEARNPGMTRAESPPEASHPDPLAVIDAAMAPSEAHAIPESGVGSRHEPTPAPAHHTGRPLVSSPSAPSLSPSPSSPLSPPPSQSPSSPGNAPAAPSAAALALRDPAVVFAQAERELQNNDPRKALDIVLGYTTDPLYRHGAGDLQNGNQIMAMAHCQLRSIEAADRLYKLLVPREQARVLAFCKTFGIELTAD